jgi:hypothetical protein
MTAEGHVEDAPSTKVVTLNRLNLDGVRLDYVHASKTAGTEKQTAQKAARTAEKAKEHPELLLKIDEAKITDSEFGFVNKAAAREYRVFLANTELDLKNFSNRLKEGTATISLNGKFMGTGETKARGTFRPETNSPDFDLSICIDRTQIRAMNDLLQAYGNFDVVAGLFSLYSELSVKNRQIQGYVKPLLAARGEA